MKERVKPISVEKHRITSHASESDDYKDDEEYHSESSTTPKKKKKQKANKKPKKWESALDNDEKPKKRLARKAKEPINPNMVKSTNKLIGEIENMDLYGEDDDFKATTSGDVLGIDASTASLEIEYKQPQKKMEMSNLFKKIREKKNSIANQIVSLGMVESLSKQISANELAARGIQLSLRGEIVDYIKK